MSIVSSVLAWQSGARCVPSKLVCLTHIRIKPCIQYLAPRLSFTQSSYYDLTVWCSFANREAATPSHKLCSLLDFCFVLCISQFCEWFLNKFLTNISVSLICMFFDIRLLLVPWQRSATYIGCLVPYSWDGQSSSASSNLEPTMWATYLSPLPSGLYMFHWDIESFWKIQLIKWSWSMYSTQYL